MENSFLMVKLGSHLFILIKTPNNKIMKTSFPVFLSIMVDICFFFRWQELPKYQKREKKPKLYASYAIRSSSFIMDENFVRL